MNARSDLDRFLKPDTRDVGCAGFAEVIDVYVDLILAGADAAQRHPGVAAHLAECDACSEDLTGLLEAVREGL